MMNRIILSRIVVFFFAVCCCTSCKEKVHEELQILIRNRTDSLIHVRLYPKAEYRLGTLYNKSDVGSGFNETEFALSPNESTYDWTEVIYTSNNLDIEPHALASEVFDSIYICAANRDSIIIKFTHENVTGYSENIFSERSTWATWDFEIYEWDMQTELAKNPQRDYQYRFMILKEEMTNNQ